MVGFLLNDNNVKSMAETITLTSRSAVIEYRGGSKRGEVESYTEYWDELNCRWTTSKEMAIRNFILNKAQQELSNILLSG